MSASFFALNYDRFNSADYDGYVDFFEGVKDKFASIEVKELLDLGCGTGELSLRFDARGYDVTALDISCDMLSVAREKAANSGGENILFLEQDMRSFELYGTVDAAVCAYDCLNYLKTLKEIESCFALLNNYIRRGGILLFDMNTPYRFKNVYADNCFVFEDGDDMLVWQNDYSEKNKRCDFFLSFFEEKGGFYTRSDEIHRQKCFNLSRVKNLLIKCGFEICGVYGSTSGEQFGETSEKMYLVAKNTGGKAQG